MKDLIKLVSWAGLFVTSAALVIWSLIQGRTAQAMAFGIAAIIVMISWQRFLLWVFGIRQRVRSHLGMAPKHATLLEKEIAVNRLTDVRRALEQYGSLSGARHRRLGANLNAGLAELQAGDADIATLRWLTIEVQENEFEQYPSNAIYLLNRDGQAFVAHINNRAERHNRLDLEDTLEGGARQRSGGLDSGFVLQVLAVTVEDASEVLRDLLREASLHSVFRGRMLHLEPLDANRSGSRIRISDRPDIDDGRIILPEAVLEVLLRCVESRTKYHELLQQYGHATKTGILLHGPPGTGKTLVAKYLIGLCANYTAIVPMGMDAETIREAFRLARYLQPALIVFEDVDLLANRRETNANVTGLQVLMNEMDGLAPQSEAIVILSTNRPEVLEPALASRPGRVSQAIEFPLPDAQLRRRLLRIFAATADISRLDLERWVERTGGASPAFMEELVKKAILFAALRSSPREEAKSLALTDADFDRAIHELVVFGGALTGKILGFANSNAAETFRATP
ncbi:MAG: AAA family ATPase [Planctomycetota bacterium]|jgi:ATP-dependent 26S proteasome regulatory subunit